MHTIPNKGLIRYLGILNQERLLVVSPKAIADVLGTLCAIYPIVMSGPGKRSTPHVRRASLCAIAISPSQ